MTLSSSLSAALGLAVAAGLALFPAASIVEAATEIQAERAAEPAAPVVAAEPPAGELQPATGSDPLPPPGQEGVAHAPETAEAAETGTAEAETTAGNAQDSPVAELPAAGEPEQPTEAAGREAAEQAAVAANGEHPAPAAEASEAAENAETAGTTEGAQPTAAAESAEGTKTDEPTASAEREEPAAPIEVAEPAHPAAAPPADTPAIAAPIVPAPRPSLVPLAQPLWRDLGASHRQVLAPFESQWNSWPAAEKRRWLALAERVPRMSPENRERARARIAEWAALTPEQQRVALRNYRIASQLPPDERKAQWERYTQMTPEQRDVLRASGVAGNTAARHAGPHTGLAREAAQPLARDHSGQRATH